MTRTLQRIGVVALAAVLVACDGGAAESPSTTGDVTDTPAVGASTGTAGTSTPAATDVFTSPDGMQARFPGQPTAEPAQVPTEVGTLDVTFWVYEEDDGAMTIAAITYPIPPDQYDPEAGLDGAVDGAAQNIDGTVLSSTEISRGGLPGRDARIRASNDFIVRVLMLVDPDGPTLYQAQVVGTEDYVDGDSADLFLDSVNIVS